MLILVPYKFDRNWTMLLAKSGTFLGIFSAQYVNFLGHVLLVERMIATVLAHCYEQLRAPIINAVWFIVLVRFFCLNF